MKIGHLAKAIARAEAIVLNHFTLTLELFCGKNRSKKHEILKKWDNFENRPSWKSCSLFKMVSLGQKLKMSKTCKNQFYNNITVGLCKKTLEKSPNIGEIDNFENRPSWKSYSLFKMVSLGQKWKMPKTCKKNHSTRILPLVSAKNRSKKHQILKKWDNFENLPSCKSYSPCKGYSLCKLVSLGQKLKMPKTCKKTILQ